MFARYAKVLSHEDCTTLAPDLVAAILDDDLPDHIKLFDFSAMDPVIWDEQRALVASLITEHESIG